MKIALLSQNKMRWEIYFVNEIALIITTHNKTRIRASQTINYMYLNMRNNTHERQIVLNSIALARAFSSDKHRLLRQWPLSIIIIDERDNWNVNGFNLFRSHLPSPLATAWNFIENWLVNVFECDIVCESGPFTCRYVKFQWFRTMDDWLIAVADYYRFI